MSDFDQGNCVNCFSLDVNLYETKREKFGAVKKTAV